MIEEMRLTVLALSMCLAIPAFATPLDHAAAKRHCQKEWDGDYQMQKYCLDKTTEGYIVAQRFVDKAHADENLLIAPFERCEQEWGIQWDMVQHCMQKNLEGLFETISVIDDLPDATGTEIFGRCNSKWYPQFDMIGFSMGKQSAAWRALQ
jgi:hypothetical protein